MATLPPPWFARARSGCRSAIVTDWGPDMRLMKWAIATLAALTIPASAQSPTQLAPTKPTAAVLSTAASPTTSATGTTAHDLTKADVDAWLDGYMPYAIKSGGIPGAVVVVVKDGQPLTMRGYGY